MATRTEFELTPLEKQNRRFSEQFKREKVKLIDQGKVKVSEICRMYDVSRTSIYHWIDKYGSGPKIEKLIVEKHSETKALLEMQKRLSDLERLLGQKQIEVEFYKKMIDIAEDHYDISIKKNYSTQQSDTSGQKER